MDRSSSAKEASRERTWKFMQRGLRVRDLGFGAEGLALWDKLEGSKISYGLTLWI